MTPQPGTSQVCSDLVGALPEVVGDAVRRDVQPPGPAVAAWGDPPVILRCGVPPPVADATTTVLQVDGVDWLPVPGEGGTFFTSVGRAARVEVAVPQGYAPEADVLSDLTDAVVTTVPLAPGSA